MKIPKPIRYILAILPILWIATLVKPQDFFYILKNTAYWTIPLYLIANLISFILQGTRWWMLIHAFIPSVSYLRAMRYHFTGIFYSIILPSSAAQDVVRSVLISREEDYGTIWASSWIARLFGMLSLFIMSLYGFLMYSEIRQIEYVPLYGALLLLLILSLIALSFSKRTMRPIAHFIKIFLPKKIFSILKKIYNGIYIFKHRKKRLLAVFAVTMLFHITLFTAISFMIMGITGELKIAEVFAFAPIIEFICMTVPITPNGMGVREILSKQMFDYMGFNDDQLAVYVLVVLISIVFRLIGGIPILFDLPKKS